MATLVEVRTKKVTTGQDKEKLKEAVAAAVKATLGQSEDVRVTITRLH